MSAALQPAAGPLRVALVGSPNAGKTTLFNWLTGSSARVGNYAGVTVERREGVLRHAERDVRVLDLPGTYGLLGETPDEKVVEQVLEGTLEREPVPDAILAVLDATTLRRGLGLLYEVLERGRPTALVLTMIDEVKARGGKLDLTRLSALLGIPVLGVVGHRGVGVEPLTRLLQDPSRWTHAKPLPPADNAVERLAWADRVCERIGVLDLMKDSRTDRIDRVLLHPIAGLVVFVAVMVFLFQSIFTWAAPAMDAIDGTIGRLAVTARTAVPAGWVADLLADGVIAGVGSVLVFVPQIVVLFTLIHLLNDVGYMARAAFVVDRVMGWVGLQGRSFVPLLSCFACAVPGIMAARTIASPRERLATILVAPFMTCSARLPLYTLLIAAFVPSTMIFGLFGAQGLVMFGLYLLGAIVAFASAALLNSTLLRGTPSVFYMELPPYRWPTLRILGQQVWHSVRAFLRRAGTIILATSIVLWALLSYPKADGVPGASSEVQARADLEASAAAQLGRAIEPAIRPLGFDWKIGVGLVASLAAREVIVATFAQIHAVGSPDDFTGLRDALRADVDPRTGRPVFDLPVALSLLVFFVFALQCTSTVAVMARETGTLRWPAFALTYSYALAWVASFVTYNLTKVFV